jgi:predicted phage terminase large subunit-like protein
VAPPTPSTPAGKPSGDGSKRAQLSALQQQLLTIPYSQEAPTPKQARFLLDLSREALYGGAAGGGKSSALLMAALQFIAVPGYAAIIFRRTYQDLSLPGALMDRCREWLYHSSAKWNDETHTWTFPNQATLTFGYLEHENDRLRYQGSEFQFVGMDEVTQLLETSYRYLFSRLRKPADGPLSRVPLRMRAATNPGGPGHGWVARRFIEPWEQWKLGKAPKPLRNFHPATLDDNPHLDRDEYAESLMQLDPVTRAQLLRGDWSVRPEGRMFKREWWPVLREEPLFGHKIRFWDLAATDEKPGIDPDWTAGCLLHRDRAGAYTVLDMIRRRSTHFDVEKLVRQTAEIDGRNVPIYMDQDPGQAGKAQAAAYRRLLDGFEFHTEPSSGKKTVRAAPVASQAEAGNIRLLIGPWIGDFLDEIEIFPDGEHDDQVDALSGAHAILSKRAGAMVVASPTGVTQSNPWRV